MTPIFIITIGLMLAVALLPIAAKLFAPLAGPVDAALGIVRRFLDMNFWIAAGTTFLIAVAQITSVITRNVFGVNFIWLQESATYLFAALFLLPAGAILLKDGHVRVDVLYTQWPALRQRWINLAGLYLFILPVSLLVVYASAPYVTQSWAAREGSQDPSGIQAVFLLKSLIPLFGLNLAGAVGVGAHDLLRGYPLGHRPIVDDQEHHGHVG